MMIVFDLDDTLYKEKDYVESGVKAVAKAVASSGNISEDQALRLITGASTVSAGFDALCSYLGENCPGIPYILGIYRNHKPTLRLPEESRTFLEELIGRGITLGLITDGRATTQYNKIEALGLSAFIRPDNIIVSGEQGFDKHSPEPFRRIMEMNPDEDTYIYIGDNPEKDFLWPNRLGWKTVMLRDTDNVNIHTQNISQTPGYSIEQEAQISVNTLSEILKQI